MPKKQSGFAPPKAVPPLILVDTGNRTIIDGKRYRILAIERASHTDVNYKNITPKTIKKQK